MTTSRLYTGAARALDGIPVVPTTAARNARYPSPPDGFRVDNRETGLMERYDAGTATWFPVASATLVRTPESFGAVGDGTTDDTAAIQRALDWADARSSGAIEFTAPAYRTTAPLEVGGFTTLRGLGLFGSIIKKRHTGDAFQVSGNYNHFLDMFVQGDTDASPTYGEQGIAVHFNSAAGGYGCTWRGGGIYGCDFMFKYAVDAGHSFRCSDAFLQQYDTVPGNEENAIWVTGDNSAGFRQFANCIFFSKVKLVGALDFMMTGCVLRSMECDFNSQIITLSGCVLANNGNAQSWGGRVMQVIGCRIAGDVTLESGSFGDFIGNRFTSGSLTDSSPGLWQIVGSTGISNNLTGDLQLSGKLRAVGAYHSFGTATAYTDRLMHVTGSGATATTQYGILLDGRGDSAGTSNIIGLYCKTGTAAAAYTAANVESIRAVNPVAGAGSTITKAVGLRVEDMTTGGTNYAIQTGLGINEFGGAVKQKSSATTEATLIAGIDALLGNVYTVTLTAARLVAAPSNPLTGQRITFVFLQDATGGRAVTWNAVFKQAWSDTGNTANKRSTISFIYDGTNWNQDGAQSPYI